MTPHARSLQIDTTGEFVPAGHFYSVVPSQEGRRRYIQLAHLTIPTSLPGININRDAQIRLLDVLKPYFDTCAFPDEKQAGKRYYFLNPAYSYADALVLNAMIRHFAPRRIIEIGSGYSSAAVLDTNEQSRGEHASLVCVDPYPDILTSLLTNEDKKDVTLLADHVQNVDPATFRQLKPNDFLFIDSTHVSKLGSDVNFLFFEIFPCLAPGVLIHLHDIFWPFEYPKDWIAEGRAWNEAYLLRAFLQHNDEYEVLLFNDYLWTTHNTWFRDKAPAFARNSGGSFWMRKVI